MNDGGIADDDGMTRNVKVDEGVRRDQHVVADRYAADDHRVRADPNAIADFGRSRSLAAIRLTDRYAGGDVAVFADCRGGIDNNASKMPDIKTASDLRFCRDLNMTFIGVSKKPETTPVIK